MQTVTPNHTVPGVHDTGRSPVKGLREAHVIRLVGGVVVSRHLQLLATSLRHGGLREVGPPWWERWVETKACRREGGWVGMFTSHLADICCIHPCFPQADYVGSCYSKYGENGKLFHASFDAKNEMNQIMQV